jgi:hypothetical protein
LISVIRDTKPADEAAFMTLSKSHAVFPMIVSILAIIGVFVVFFIGYSRWKDFRLGLYLLIAILIWSAFSLASSGMILATQEWNDEMWTSNRYLRMVVFVGGSSMIRVCLESFVFSLLFQQWLTVLIPEGGRTNIIRRAIVVVLIILNVALIIGGITVYVVFRGRHFDTIVEVSNSGFYVMLSLALTWLLLLIGGCMVCVLWGIRTLKLTGTDLMGLWKTFIIFALICAGFLIQALFFYTRSSVNSEYFIGLENIVMIVVIIFFNI